MMIGHRLTTLALAMLLAACSEQAVEQSQQRSAPKPVQIITHTIAMRADRNELRAIGTARAKYSATLYPKTAGAVTAVNFKAGERVSANALLLELDAREEALALKSAEVALRDATQLLNRYRRVKSSGAISANQIDSARIAQQAARLQRDSAQLALSERQIKAPFAGHVGITDIDPGTRITPQTAITRLDDRSELFVDFAAPEEFFRRIKIGDVMEILPFADSERPVSATVRAVDSHIDANTRSFTVRSVIDNRDDQLRPGMSFRVRFSVEGASYPTVPEAAIVWGGDGAYLWAVRDGKAKRMSLTIVARHEDLVLIRAPLKAGDLIVAEGVQKLREGTPVVDPEQAAPDKTRPNANGQPVVAADGAGS